MRMMWMMRIRKPAFGSGFARCTSGQALLETALVLPLLLALVFNCINFGYFFLVALNLSAAPRSGVEYSILGQATPGSIIEPATALVSTLTTADLTGALNTGATTPVQVCSKTPRAGALVNPGAANQTAKCDQFNSSPSYAPASDPESPAFVLQRVDVTYSFKPIIPGAPFGIALMTAAICSAGTCKFHRQVSMRAMD
jgi:Flp pilus assembly protein TadG